MSRRDEGRSPGDPCRNPVARGHTAGRRIREGPGRARRDLLAQIKARLVEIERSGALARLEDEARAKPPPATSQRGLAQDRHRGRRRALRHSLREGDPHSGARHRQDGRRWRQDQGDRRRLAGAHAAADRRRGLLRARLSLTRPCPHHASLAFPGFGRFRRGGA